MKTDNDGIEIVSGDQRWVVTTVKGVNGWTSVKVIDTEPPVRPSKNKRQKWIKRFYNLGWNGKRFASSTELEALTERFPEIVEKLKFELSQKCSECSGNPKSPHPLHLGSPPSERDSPLCSG